MAITKNENDLSLKQQRFVELYLVYMNASKAYRESFGEVKNVGQASYKLLREPKIQKAIQKAVEERSRRTHVDQDRVIRELARVGFANIKSVIESWDGITLRIRDSNTISDDDVAAIREITYKIGNNGIEVNVQMHDKMKSLLALLEHTKPEGSKKDPIEEARRIQQAVAEMAESMGDRT